MFSAGSGTYLSTSIQGDELQRWTTNLNTPDRVRQQFAVDPLQLLEVLAVACVRCVVDVRDLLDAGDMLQLQKRLLTFKQVDTGVKLDTLVGFQMRIGSSQRAICEAYYTSEGIGGWISEEGFEDCVSCYAGGAEDEGSQRGGGRRHCEL